MDLGKIHRIIKNPKIIIYKLCDIGAFNWMDDETYLKMKFRLKVGYKLNLDNPRSFNEKIQWLKLHDRRPEYTELVDKYEVKKIVSDLVGEEYVIPTIGIYDSFDEIDFDKLPQQFVLKCTHDSGGIVICKDKSKLNLKQTRKKIEKCLKTNYFWIGREWAYKNVKPRIICEKYMEDKSGELFDYKVFNFDGKPKLIQVDYDRFAEHKRNLYSTDWEYIDAEICYPTDKTRRIERPVALEKMLDLSSKISDRYPHARIDFYNIDDAIYFGEVTLYHGSGFEDFRPKELGIEMGSWLNLQGGTSQG